MEDSSYELLPGERFCPMEDELLMYYLKPKVHGQEVPGKETQIGEVDLYGEEDPWSIWNRFEAEKANDLRKNKDLYFFTKQKNVSVKGSRKCRRVGGGTWKGQDSGNEIYLLDQNNKETETLLGCRKTYTYKNEGSVHHGQWIMYEYELDKSQFLHKEQVDQNQYVLCLLRKNDTSSVKKRKRQQEGEVLEDNGDNIEPIAAIVHEEPQENRQCLLPCPDNAPASPSLERAELKQWVDSLLVEAPLETIKPEEVDLNGGNLSNVMDGGAYCPNMYMEGSNQLTNNEQQPSTMAGGEWTDESNSYYRRYFAY